MSSWYRDRSTHEDVKVLNALLLTLMDMGVIGYSHVYVHTSRIGYWDWEGAVVERVVAVMYSEDGFKEYDVR